MYRSLTVSINSGLLLATILLAAVPSQPARLKNTSHIKFIYPNGLALDERGSNLYISDIGAHAVFKLDRQGRLNRIAGTGEGGFSGDGGPALKAQLHAPHDLALDNEGRLLIADSYNHRIRRIDRNGVITTIAGNGLAPASGYDQAAPKDTLNNPQGIACDRAGNILIADTYNRVVRKLAPNGSMTIIAGGVAGLTGDGGLAVESQLNLPMAVAIASDATIVISDAANSRLRRVALDGKIHTIAGFGGGDGLGGAGFAGDEGPAAKAKLFSPADIKVDAAGNIFISDSGNNRIRVIRGGLAGTITTVAGTGRRGFSGDGRSSALAELNTPQKIAIAKDGSIFIADRGNQRVRKVDSRGIISTVASVPKEPEIIR